MCSLRCDLLTASRLTQGFSAGSAQLDDTELSFCNSKS
jgi:hypothetical protein